MYLLRRGALFHFSRKLPDAFQGQNLNLASGPRKVGGNGYLRFSLGTGNRREAERLARRYAVEVDEALQAETASMHREIPCTDEPEGTILKEFFDTLPAEQQAHLLQFVKPVPRPKFSQEEIQQAAQLMYASIMQEDEAEYRQLIASQLAPGMQGDDAEDRLLIPRESPYFVGDLPPPGVVGDIALLKELKINIAHFLHLATGRDVNYWRLDAGFEPFATAFRAASRDLRRRQAGESVASPELPVTPSEKHPTALSWQGLLEYWQQDCERRPRTVQEMQTLIQSLSSFLPNKTPATVTRKDAAAWLRHQRDTRGNRAKTLEKKGTLMGALFSIAVKDEILSSNPLADFDYARFVQKIGVDTGEDRKPFSQEQLARIFSPEGLFSQRRQTGGGGYHARIWLPLLGLFTGARLDELGRLTLQNFESVPLPHFRIRRGKNDESLRQIPLHPQLIELGFLDYVEAIKASGQERLWPFLKTRGINKNDSEVLGRWFNGYIHKNLGFPDNVVFHSFRHTFKDLCRNAHIPKDAHHQLTGHSSSDTGDSYGEGFALEVLYEEIQRITLPFTIPRPLPFTGSKTLTNKSAAGHPHRVP